MALLLLTFVAPLQMFPSIMAFIGRDTGGGTAFGIFGIFGVAWVAQAIGILHSGGDKPSAMIGLYLIGLAVCFLVLTPLISTSKPLLGALLGVSVFRTLGMAAINFQLGEAYKFATGIIGLVLCAIGIYSGFVFLFEDLHLKPTPLTLRIGNGRHAIKGRTEDQISQLMREVGIRREL